MLPATIKYTNKTLRSLFEMMIVFKVCRFFYRYNALFVRHYSVALRKNTQRHRV
jgi:hypothetical protein